MSRALVLGGGGPVGIGWQAGLLQGLTEGGMAVGDADLVLGTSAGSVVGAQLAAGRELTELVPFFAKAPASRSYQAAAAALDLAVLQSDPDDLPSEPEFLERFAILQGLDWPETFRCVSFDLDSSDFKVWDRSAGTDLQRAVASSCSIPGLSPAVTIGAGHYIDGGARDMLNADLAIGHDTVIAVSCLPLEAKPVLMPELIADLLAGVGGRLAELRSSGSRVELIEPTDEMAELSGWGRSLMDFARTPAAFELGLAQGRQEAVRLSGHWAS